MGGGQGEGSEALSIADGGRGEGWDGEDFDDDAVKRHSDADPETHTQTAPGFARAHQNSNR